MAFISSVRSLHEPSSKSGEILSPAPSPSSAGVVRGEDVGDRMVSENRAAGRVLAASSAGGLLGEVIGGPGLEMTQGVTPEAEEDVHNVPKHWKGEKHEPPGTTVANSRPMRWSLLADGCSSQISPTAQSNSQWAQTLGHRSL